MDQHIEDTRSKDQTVNNIDLSGASSSAGSDNLMLVVDERPCTNQGVHLIGCLLSIKSLAPICSSNELLNESASQTDDHTVVGPGEVTLTDNTGISGRSLFLFAAVYTTRYLDLICNFISLYNTFAKIFLLTSSYIFLYLVYFHYRKTYETTYDKFRLNFLLWPCILLALFADDVCSPIETLWTFSIFLEAVAIIPQMYLIHQTGRTEKYVMLYMTLLFLYRGFYILNWIYRYNQEGYYDLIPISGGIVDMVVYISFFIYYLSEGGKDKRNYFISNLPTTITDVHILKGDIEKTLLSDDKNEKNSQTNNGAIYCVGTEKSYSMGPKGQIHV